jgi:hypothetical protein
MFKNNESINSLELANITKKVFILFIKDLITLTSSNKELSIEKALTQLQKGVPSPLPTTPIGVEGLGGLTPASIKTPFGSGIGRFDLSKPTRPYNLGLGKRGHGFPDKPQKGVSRGVVFKKYNQLLIKLINSTNSESLTRKRIRLSKTFFNKSLLAKLTKKVNNHNNNINLLGPFLKGWEKENSIVKNVSTKELIGKGILLNPVNKKKLDALLT